MAPALHQLSLMKDQDLIAEAAGGGVLPMTDNKQHDTRTARRPDCVTEIRMGNSVLVVSGYFKKDTTTTAADKMARVLEAEAAATQEPTYPA